jgi:uncharacterized protein
MSRKTRYSDRPSLRAGALALLAMLCFAAPQVMAQGKPLDAPRAAGTVGERFDGYVVLRDGNAPQSVKNLVAQTNAERKALYAKRAAEQKVPVDAIGKIYAQQIINSAPKGTYFLEASGKWTRR